MPKLFAPIIFVITTILTLVFTMFCSVPMVIAGVFKLLLPFKVVSRGVSAFCNFMMWCWCVSLALILKITNRIEWDIEGAEDLSKQTWYLLISNHKSWTDIVSLCVVMRNRIPMNKYFLKQQLAWVPFIGIACWALDMPFMRRYSRAYLIKHPEKRGKDIETTRHSCEKFRNHPTTIVNFVEGSRFTEQKREQLNSPYQNLLPPKSAGIALALNVLGAQFDRILNVTLYYPENEAKPFIDLLSGQMKRIVIRIETLPVDDSIRGDYMNDKAFKRQFQQWLHEVWQRKDLLLSQLKEQFSKPQQ
ncbi:acyltransferase [Limnobaculum parvum]|uniref:Acyltransferase n=1 Tax=Limnobaculum parvum TaxID=2172103 RepID=A0A2Y9TZ55_9GAMM|nr:acyltransferase [Limnobaculum parvum]AWH88965.1 acyltransferase [Limnobaculum parvum]